MIANIAAEEYGHIELAGADMMKLFPLPRIPTDKIPECKPHLDQGLHLKLYRFSPDDDREMDAVFNGPHPETGEELEVVDEAPEGFAPNDLPPQDDVFAPDYAPGEIAEIAQKLRKSAGLPDKVTGVVANDGGAAPKDGSRHRSDLDATRLSA